MFGRHRPQQKRGKPIAAKTLNAPHNLLQQLSRMRGGRGTFWTTAGPMIAQPGTPFRVGITGPDGIGAASSPDSGQPSLGYADDISDCWIQVNQPGSAVLQISDDSADFEGYNLSQQAVAGNAVTLYMSLWNIWVCIWEDCPSSSDNS